MSEEQPMSLHKALSTLQIQAREHGHPGIAEAAARLRRTLGSRQAIRFRRLLSQPVTLAPAASPRKPPEPLPEQAGAYCQICERVMFCLVTGRGARVYFCPVCDVNGGHS
jgi:hypothetical protein